MEYTKKKVSYGRSYYKNLSPQEITSQEIKL